jgi:hypothetical protein
MRKSIKRLFTWQVIMGIVFICLSCLVYFAHYLLFRDPRYIASYIIMDVAFLFLEVFLVTLVVHNLLDRHDKKVLRDKLNMLIGAFYSEVGTRLVRFCAGFDPAGGGMSNELKVSALWTRKEFSSMSRRLKSFPFKVEHDRGSLEQVKALLVAKRDFLVSLLANPNLLEHESFTSLLWAVFHLTEELENRSRLDNLPAKDYEHLEGDIRRAYVLLVNQWLDYTEHLQEAYPYLFSLAVRTNPFDRDATVEIH